MNTADYLLEHGRDNDIAIIANNLEYTYADLRQASARLVAEMLTSGVGPAIASAFWATIRCFGSQPTWQR